MSRTLPPLDLHAHISPGAPAPELERLGAIVFAATRSLSEYESVRSRRDQVTIWGLGCHPGVAKAQREYDATTFASLLPTTPFVSEVGLERRSEVPLVDQRRVLDSILEELRLSPRVVSIHSAGAQTEVLDALEQRPILGAVLHWWRGSPEQTRRAVALGCWFSINTSGLTSRSDLGAIPLDRLLTETDHPSGDRKSPAPRQPGAVVDVELALAAMHGVDPATMRKRVWENFVGLVDATGVYDMLPPAVRRMTDYARSTGSGR